MVESSQIFVKKCSLYIANGRIGDDAGLGNTTCKDTSVIDYVHSDLFNIAVYFNVHEYIYIFCKLFNVVLDSGIVPENWLIGIIKPIYKNKGDKSNPDNFRAITLISCRGKLFTSILNARLNEFSNEFEVISKNQAGFRKSHSTVDNIFVLYSLISLYLSSGKKLFCTFIDFRRLLILSGDLDCGASFKAAILTGSVLELYTICITILNRVLNTKTKSPSSFLVLQVFVMEITYHLFNIP